MWTNEYIRVFPYSPNPSLWISSVYSCVLNLPSSYLFFSVRLLSVLCDHSAVSSPPQRPMTSDFEGFSSQILSITFFVLSLFIKKSQYFPFQCWVPKKGTSGTNFKTSLVWSGPWLGIEPGTSRTRSQHSTTRLSMRLNLPSDLFVYQQNVCFNIELKYRCVKRSSNY